LPETPTLAYHNTATITGVKKFIVQAIGDSIIWVKIMFGELCSHELNVLVRTLPNATVLKLSCRGPYC
jgi:hypothetical protein